MAGATEAGVIFAHHELAIGVGFGLANFNQVVLVVGEQRVIELHGAIATAQFAFRNNGPRVGMAEDGGVFFDAFIDAADKSDFVIRLGKSRPEQMDAVL